MLDKLNRLKDDLNGSKAEKFKTEGLGQFLTGDVTLLFGPKPYTMSFFKGTVVGLQEGIPLSGIDFGVGGPEEGWQELYQHKNFSRAISPKHGKLTLQGNMVRAMSNLNCLGYVAKALCNVMN